MGGVEISCAGQSLRLLPQRAALWREGETLILADPHFGKDAAFRSAGIPVPGGAFDATLARLNELVHRTECRRLLILGDFFHARPGRTDVVLEGWTRWRAANPRLPIDLVRGNHDRHAGDPPPGWDITVHAKPLHQPPFEFRHEPPPGTTPRDGLFRLCGHVHPAVGLTDRAGIPQRLPCFMFREREPVGLLPAFGEFTGARKLRPEARDRVFVIAGDEVVEVA
jgi:DNA ligase-associated metallophosphoesterase